MSSEKINLTIIERIKDRTEQEALLVARGKTWMALNQIAAAIRPGMFEEEVYRLSLRILKEMGISKYWHRPWIRLGTNTLKSFGQLSEVNVQLSKDDIFFIDIGPVWNGYEGDAGETSVVGGDPEMLRCKEDIKKIFLATKERWQQERLTGSQLYDFAQKLAQNLGWVLNLEVNGHTLSDFPHVLHYRGNLADLGVNPSPYNWVLEIQIRHPTRNFGAFYEDLLLL